MIKRCIGFCFGTQINMQKLVEYLSTRYACQKYRGVIHLSINSADIFIFSFASMVCWGSDQSLEQELLKEIKPFVVTNDETLCEDEFSYTYGHTANIKDDEIVLPNHDILSKLAFSYPIAQSVKLDVFERTIQKTVDITRNIPQTLATKGKITLSGSQIRRMIGRLFLDRHSINLHQELLNIPDFFWEYPDLEPIYKITAQYLEISRRVAVINERLNVIKELFDMLNNEINHKHSSRLEWTIIWLIVIEVSLALAKDIFHVI